MSESNELEPAEAAAPTAEANDQAHRAIVAEQEAAMEAERQRIAEGEAFKAHVHDTLANGDPLAIMALMKDDRVSGSLVAEVLKALSMTRIATSIAMLAQSVDRLLAQRQVEDEPTFPVERPTVPRATDRETVEQQAARLLGKI